MTSLPNTVGPNGQIIVNSGPPLHTGFIQHIQGSPLEAAAGKTIAAQQGQAAAARALGAGQKGASRKRRRRQRGGVNLNANIPSIPEAGTIPGVSHVQNHLNAVNAYNQIGADKVYDGLANATPIKMGGFRLRDAEDLYPGSGTQDDTKRSRRTKKHGSRNKRTHRRISRKSTSRRSRRRRAHK